MWVKQCDMSVDDMWLAPSKPRCRRRRQCRGLCDPRHARSHRWKQQRGGGKNSSRRHAWRPRLAWSPSCPWRHALNPKPWNPKQRHHANNRGYGDGDGATNHSVLRRSIAKDQAITTRQFCAHTMGSTKSHELPMRAHFDERADCKQPVGEPVSVLGAHCKKLGKHFF